MVDSNALISVIVPIYNIEQYVGFCIESIIKQTYTNLEIILVDDGSTDRCPALCDLYASKDSRIKVIHKANGGLVSARKAGVSIAKGEYIAHVDGDDWVEPTYYEKLVDVAVKNDADIVCAGYCRDFFEESVRCNDSFASGLYQGAELDMLHRKMICFDEPYKVGITTYVWNKLFKASIAKDTQLSVDEVITIGEDAAVTYPAFLLANRVYISDDCLYHYRQREGSMLKLQDNQDTTRIKLKALYTYLKSKICSIKNNDLLIEHLKNFVIGNFIIRSGGLIEGVSLFPENIEGKRVAIVFAGSFGQMMYKRFTSTGYCDVVGWFDDDYWQYRRLGMNVDSLDMICDKEYDFIIIAKLDWCCISSLKSRIISYGVDIKKILEIHYNNTHYFSILTRILE